MNESTDGIIETFEPGNRDGISAIGQEFGLIAQQTFSEAPQYRDVGFVGPGQPAMKIRFSTAGIRIAPKILRASLRT